MLVVGATGCERCDDQRAVWEVVPGEPFADFQQTQVDNARADGWECTGEPIRSGAGAEIGTRYVCTVCR